VIVEVPFFPRQRIQRGGRRQWRERKRKQWIALGVGAGSFLAILVVGILVWLGFQRTAREARLTGAEERAERLLAAGDLPGAIAALDELIRASAKATGGSSERLVEYRRRRSELVQRDFEETLADLSGLGAEEGLETLSRLQSRLKVEPVLEQYRGVLSEAERAQRIKVVERGLEEVRFLQASGDAARVLGRSEELMRVIQGDMGPKATALRERLEDQVQAAVQRAGLVVELDEPEFLTAYGERGWYIRQVLPACAAMARERGYVVGSEIPEFQAIWAERKPYRIRVMVREEYGSFYEQSANRTTRVDLTVLLERGEQVVWQTRYQARTRVPPPGLGNRAAGNLGVSEKVNPEFEKYLHEDARKVLLEMLGGRLRGMPPREQAARLGVESGVRGGARSSSVRARGERAGVTLGVAVEGVVDGFLQGGAEAFLADGFEVGAAAEEGIDDLGIPL
jgi:hypothetical protein